MGLSEPMARVGDVHISPVALKPHFSITLPDAGLSMKCPLISDFISVVALM